MRKLYLFLGFCCLSGSASLSAQDHFVGQIMIVPYQFTPSGWHDCDGAILPIEDNEVLYNLIGTTYGGNGQTTFALPDARGRVIVDDGNGNGFTTMVNGQKGGVEAVTLTLPQIPSHTHTVNAVATAGISESPAASLPANTGLLDKEYSNQVANTTMSVAMLLAAGSSQPHDNMQPYLTMKCIIALTGYYPTQN